MEIVRSAGELRAARRAACASAASAVALRADHGGAPRGAPGAGAARPAQLADRAVASVFVNPTQFGPARGPGALPAPARARRRAARRAPAAICSSCPAVETIYPPGHATFVEPGGAALGLEGDRRPGHFRGVATVVTALFHLVEPDLAVFGEKDAQQLAVVRQLVRDLHFPVEIVGHPTVREPDGLAMSSRNAFLDPEERRAAPVLYRGARSGARGAGGERRAPRRGCARPHARASWRRSR